MKHTGVIHDSCMNVIGDHLPHVTHLPVDLDFLPISAAAGSTTTCDSATMRLVSTFSATSLTSGLNQNSHGKISGWPTIIDSNANNAKRNVNDEKESLVARNTEDCQQTKLRTCSKVRDSVPVSTLRNTTNQFVYMHKCVRRCSHGITNINYSGYKRKTYRPPCILRSIPATNCRN